METKNVKNPQSEEKKRSKSNEYLKEAGKFGAASAAGAMGGFASGMAKEVNDENIVEPEPTPEPSPAQEPEPAINPGPGPEPSDVEPEPIIEPEPIEEPSGNDPEEERIDDVEEEIVDPELIAEAIIAGEEIDPYDIDAADIVNFEEVGTVYTVDGESYTAALFHDESGDQYMMVDVDDDDVFDVITTTDGEVVEYYAGELTVEDAEIGMVEQPVYIASNDYMPEIDPTSGEDFINDIING